MGRRVAPLVLAGTLLLALALPAGSSAVYPNPNPWLTKRFLNIAHQGGEDEAPSNTLFAFKTAIKDRGADMLELDVNLTMDGHLVVIHDDTVNRTTEETENRASGNSMIRTMTLAAVQALDAGYSFASDGTYSDNAAGATYPFRGIRTGLTTPPAGYTPDDFKIPTLREVLDAFPNTLINIEIKMEKHLMAGPPGGGCQQPNNPSGYCDDAAQSEDIAEALAAVLDEPQYSSRSNDFIVVSFDDSLVQHFRDSEAPPYVPVAPGLTDAFLYGSSGATPTPDVAAFQVPPVYFGLEAPEFLLKPVPGARPGAHEDGYAVHVWANGNEGEAEYEKMVKLGVDGYMASEPGRLHKYLCATEVPRPDGSDRCPGPKKKCKKKKKGGKKKQGKKSAKGKKKKKKKKCKKKKKGKKKGKK